MEPLTIEELKSLKVGDWVWIVRDIMGISEYRRIQEIDENSGTVTLQGVEFIYTHPFRLYGKTWLAYKNKEQAETRHKELKAKKRISYSDKPKELGEFRKPPCEKSEKYCENCKYKHHDHNGEIYCKDDNRAIIRPPQSWCDVEEV